MFLNAFHASVTSGVRLCGIQSSSVSLLLELAKRGDCGVLVGLNEEKQAFIVKAIFLLLSVLTIAFDLARLSVSILQSRLLHLFFS